MALIDILKKYFEPTPNVRVRDVLNPINLLQGTRNTASSIGRGVVGAGQSSFRGFAALGGALTKQPLTPISRFQRDLYGTDKPITLRSFGSELGLNENRDITPFAGFAVAASDLIPGGKATRTAVVNALKNTKKVDEAAKVMSKLLGMSSKVASKYAPEASKLTDTKSLNELVDKALKESQDVLEIGKRAGEKIKTLATYKGEKDLTTKILKDLEGKTTVSKQYILDATNRGELKQVERDLIRQVLDDMSPKKADGYTMSHRPTEGVRAFNLTEKVNGEEMIPKDMYEKWYGSRGTKADLESISALKAIKDKPEANVTIYRASPKPDFNDGDWVSLSKEYATEHATGNGTKVHSKVVKAKDLKWAMDDINEFGYYPEKSDTINVSNFAKKVKAELLPLKVKSSRDITPGAGTRGMYSERNGYESISLDPQIRGDVKNYFENVYESPIKTSAGSTHPGLPKSDSYFGHTRIEDMADNKTRRVIEVQSDLYQKGNLENELMNRIRDEKGKYTAIYNDRPADILGINKSKNEAYIRPYKGRETPVPLDDFLKQNPLITKDVSKLQQYNDPTAHFRMVREEIKKAAQDGKTKLQFPTGETAMKIEGLGSGEVRWTFDNQGPASISELKVGREIWESDPTMGMLNEDAPWIITDVLGDGKFKAVPKDALKYSSEWKDEYGDNWTKVKDDYVKIGDKLYHNNVPEEFDISGKVDTNNPIYKFYEKDVQKYLNKFGGKPVVDENGVAWIEVPIDKRMAKQPVEAFGAFGGLEEDEEGKLSFDPLKAGLGVAGFTAAQKGKKALQTRGFIQSAQEVIPKADKIAGQYIPRGTDDLAVKAKNFIATDLVQAEKYALENADDKAVAMASELLKKYADDAVKSTDPRIVERSYEKAAEIANTLAPKLTEQGRSIQAASILGRLTPEGQLRFAAREIQKYNEANPLKKIPNLTAQQSEIILTEMKAINEMAEGTEKAMAFQKLQNYIKDLVPTPLIEKVISVWKAGLLTGIKTQGLNIFSNLFHATSEIVKDIPAVVVDSVASLFTGERTKTLTAKGLGGGLKEGFNKGLRYFKTGYDERNIAAKLDYKQTNFGKGKVAKVFQAYTDTVFRFLGAQDQPFYYGALTRSLNDQALAQAKNAKLKGKELKEFAQNLVENPTEEMIRYAVLDAQTAVFQNKTKLGELARGVQKMGGGLGELVLPFAKTPSAVAMQIVNYSPVGVVKTIAENIRKGKFNQRLFSQGIGRGLTGTAVMFLGMELYKKKMMSLDFPVGDEREQELQKAEGKRDNAIKMGGKWRSPIALGPGFGNLLLVGGQLQKAIETSGSPSEAMFKALSGVGKSFTQQTFMTGVEDFVNAITKPEIYAKSYLPGLVASAVPTIVGDVAKATDPKERRTGGENILDMAKSRIQARIPGARTGLEPQIDILGREREAVGNPLELMADPTRPTKEVGTPVTEELRRLTDAGFKVSPTLLGDKNGFKNMSKEENTELWKYTGKIVNDKLTSLFSLEAYKSLPKAEKVKTIEKIVNQAKINARAGIAIQLTDGLQGEELKKKLSELKAGGLLTKEVFTKYLQLR